VLSLRIEDLVITNQSNRIQCIIVNDQPANLSIHSNNKVWSQIYGLHVYAVIPPYHYGIFTCLADNVSKSSLVSEKGKTSFSITTLFNFYIRFIGYIQGILNSGCYTDYNVSERIIN